MSRSLLLAALLASSSALAFAPGTTYQGVEPQRIWRFDPLVQLDMAQEPTWLKFTGGEGQGWAARFDEKTGTAHRMWGPGIALNTTSDDVLSKSVVDFVTRHGLSGVTSGQLQVHDVMRIARTDRIYVDADVLFDGHPVYRGGVAARIEHGKLVMLGIDTYPHAVRVGTENVDASTAATNAIAAGPAASARHNLGESRLMWLPEEVRGKVQLRLVWQVRSETQEPRGKWVSFVDATDGSLVAVYNDVRFAAGTVSGEHEIRTVDDDVITSPLPFVKVTDGAETVNADALGQYVTSGDGIALHTVLDGTYVKVVNEGGAEGALDFAGPEAIWSTENATQAEIHSYKFIHDVRLWAATVAPEVRMSHDKITSHVNTPETCNAYYDGDVNFFKAGQGCNNTGRIADVNYHEWGHGFHAYSIPGNEYPDGSIGEGAADVVAFFQTADNIVAPGFMTNGDGIRDVAPDRVYPQDFITNDLYVHENGLIFGGSLWDLWGMLNEQLGEEQGTIAATNIFTGLLKGNPVIETSYDEAVFADDDDANLENGTPNFCTIVTAFAGHGLGPQSGTGGPVRALIDPEVSWPAGEAAPIDASVFNSVAQCIAWDPTSAAVHWRVDGGEWQDTALTVADVTASGAIPAQADGSFVEYYVTVTNEQNAVIAAPVGGLINPFSYYQGDVLEISCEDFEAGDGGFTHELIDGKESLGADDWQWGVPMGQAGDPTAAYSGDHVWGNDLGDGDYNGEYQNEVTNRLSSPSLNTGSVQGAFLAYRRWLTVEDAQFDHARLFADGNEVWANHASTVGDEHSKDSQWAAQVIDLAGAADDGAVVLQWELESDEGLGMGGWNIDDVCLYAPSTPENRLAISDFEAGDEEEGGITLTWTNPRFAPVERVVVVRATDAFPTGPEDGDVVYDSPVEVGAPVSFVDDTARKRHGYYYAVYATDGTNWLSTTVDGLNADIGSTAGAADRGCGCDGTSSGVGIGGAGLGLAVLLTARRRR